MNMFNVLLVLNSVQLVLLQTCSELVVHEIAQTHRTLAGKNGISCLLDLTLDQCALECLLLKMCKSFNFESEKKEYRTMCELNSLNHIENEHYSLENRLLYKLYVDIQNWPNAAAGTCASRPCTETQRCLPTTPYRCIDIDCGTPPVLPVENEDTNMYLLPTNTSFGSRAYYKCHDKNKDIDWKMSKFSCVTNFRICNSNSAWSLNNIFCK